MSRRFRVPRLRVIPLTITMASLMMFVKVSAIYQDGSKLRDMVYFPDAYAEEKAKEEATKEPEKKAEDAGHGDEAKKEDEHGDKKAEAEGEKKDGEEKSAEADQDAKPAESADNKEEAAKEDKKEDGHGDEAKKEDEHGDKKAEAEGDKKDGKEVELASLEKQKAAEKEPKREFSQIELDILQNLTKRREELESREKEFDLKNNMLDATELRINDKLKEMKQLKDEVQILLKQHNEQEDTKIKSLVKIYENMKPKDAAAIFNELDMPILLLVVDKMSERKVAPVLALMDPKKAMEVTTQLAEQRKLTKLPDATSIN